LKRRAIADRPSRSGNSFVPFDSRERCLLGRRSTNTRSADESKNVSMRASAVGHMSDTVCQNWQDSQYFTPSSALGPADCESHPTKTAPGNDPVLGCFESAASADLFL
jgi:hypothetical protein